MSRRKEGGRKEGGRKEMRKEEEGRKERRKEGGGRKERRKEGGGRKERRKEGERRESAMRGGGYPGMGGTRGEGTDEEWGTRGRRRGRRELGHRVVGGGGGGGGGDRAIGCRGNLRHVALNWHHSVAIVGITVLPSRVSQ
ncbi:hypothetical protein Pmani_009184 [Petrolisthes manimaculis]|uniref:Uncharacterized protein n=1 Tax=Petrolisthes manimaculis TaxID=1843537 RepID=A0AAE1UIM9_9EUCA|nr:hypothetical protein Pmani_009184 [Petrolisthes manimaculis]